MKILIIVLLTISTAMAQLSPEQRKLEERVSALKKATSSYCDAYAGEYQTLCKENFDYEIKKEIKNLAKKKVGMVVKEADDKIERIVKEEQAVLKYQTLLADLGVDYQSCPDSKCLKNLYQKTLDDRQEASCLAAAKLEADSLGVSYQNKDTCKDIANKIRAFKEQNP